ncbi:GNAT family N-acetyltransferase [Paenarthrobacter sp. Z7-10]|uniref:GNAT family N-acetyltransferase n=1 Tax=Paenarthrobacter sp. Z7-10 TaxID=2787635 RepID=UPI0022A98105|nr:GNAT family N-acetyltransferase [Paenarthrobacter sp. Z7-10]MCZ2402431.1 GNAT family N-acetyltransferase [Paenarthrobacter sp. Z7-10]
MNGSVPGGSAVSAAAQIPLPPSTLAAGYFLLRRIKPGDEGLEQSLSRCPDVVTWTYYPPNLSADQARERVLRTQARAAEGTAARYVVELDGHPLGTAGIKNSDDAPEIFYALLPHGRGQGAATAAAAALSDWALDAGAPYVALWTLVGNAASERVARRAGFYCVDVASADSCSADSSWSDSSSADLGGPDPDSPVQDSGPRLWTRFRS